MVKRLVMCAVVVLFIASVAFTGQKKDEKAGSWSGWITDTMCGAKGAKAGHTACGNKCVKENGAKVALYDTESKKVYVLEPQDKAVEHMGHEVTVKGELKGDTIEVTSIEMKPAKGM